MLRGAATTLRCPPERLLRGALRGRNSSRHAAFLATSAEEKRYKAAVCTALGEPLQIQQLLRKVQLQDHEIRVKVHNAAINFSDILMIKGQYQVKASLPFTVGSEFAGEVIEVDKNVTNVKVGQRVVGMAGSGGAFAEEIVLPSLFVVPAPVDMQYSSAAALLISYATAYMALQRTCHLKEGETVLVTAAAGAVGLAAVELATKVFKAKVIGACGSVEKCEVVKSKGAIETVNYNEQSIADTVKQITKGKGVDVVLEAVGGDTFQQCLKVLAFEGRIAVIGFAGGSIPKIPANKLLLKSSSVVGIYWGSYLQQHPQAFQESIEGVMKAVAQGKIAPHVSKLFPLNEINEAMKFITDRKSTGKVVLQIQ